jgi:LmbE family N-acetylglucosaminyl deacetylase
MNLHMPNAEIFVPDGAPAADALARTTHLCLAAHQDDIEIMAFHGIRECFGRLDRHFSGLTVTDGAGSPRDGLYGRYTDEQMKTVRREEQKKAARIGEYAAHVFLDFSSAAVKDGANPSVVDDLAVVLDATRPEMVYTHNLADKHDTHVAVALRAIAAIRRLPLAARPLRLVGCEVWRDLDWLDDAHKVVLDVSGRDALAAALIGVFDSQIVGGKRYDLATMGRRRANATYYTSHGVDTAESVTYAMDLTPLVKDDALDPAVLAREHLARFQRDVEGRLAKFA